MAYDYLKVNAIALTANYPYFSGRTGAKGACKHDTIPGVTKVVDYTNVTPQSEAALTAALNKGPVAVSIEADKRCF